MSRTGAKGVLAAIAAGWVRKDEEHGKKRIPSLPLRDHVVLFDTCKDEFYTYHAQR